jgi:protocatechuate 3,4-dioxygenase, beta subunit
MPTPQFSPLFNRRHAIGQAAAAVWGSVRAQSTPALRITPSQTEGPFYPDKMPQDTDFDLLRNGAVQYTRGQATWLTGKVSDVNGKPLAGAVVEIWQCDNDGHYHHSADGGRADPAFQGFGKVQVGTDGSYRFRTLRPAQYSGRTPHIHMKVKLANRDVLTTQLYVANDPGNERDGLWRRLGADARAALTVPFVQGSDGLQAQFAIVVAV